MKLSEFEGVKEVDTWIGNLPYTVEPVDKLHTPEQMQEYAKAKCWELINWYVESTGDVNHAAEMKIWMDDEFGGHEK